MSKLRFFPTITLLLVGCLSVPVSVAPTPEPTPAVLSKPTSATPPTDRWIAPAPTRTTGCMAHDGEPDSQCTPGATDPRVTQANITTTICVAGWSATVRPSTRVTEPIKRSEMLAYGLVGVSLTDVELDHLVSLELGGAPADVANLWPEQWQSAGSALGAHNKDRVEDSAHRAVCGGQMPLANAQQLIARDWVSLGRSLGVLP